MITVQECEAEVKRHLTEKRFYHSQCVAREAGRLAERYGADPKKAEIAGMLHDIMKDTSSEEQLKTIHRFGIIMNKTETRSGKLLHAISGSAYAEHVMGLRDKAQYGEILQAIRWHTSGHANMTLLEKIVFVADFNSADREYDGVQEMRKLAEISLEAAMLEGIRFTVQELFSQGAFVDEHMIAAYNDALAFCKEDDR